jgi:exodeoxyribonuclease-3
VRIISWNCAQAFRRKWSHVDALAADVVVAIEAEHPDRLPVALLERYPHAVWVGEILYKGVLVLGREGFALEVAPEHDPSFRHVLPVSVNGARPLTVIAVWTQRGPQRTYTRHLADALAAYEPSLHGDAIVVGDFNANTVWDSQHRQDVTHSQNVARLRRLGFESLYHAQEQEEQGRESTPTIAFRRHLSEPFHIDYCFASRSLRERGAKLEIPPMEKWVALSDHAPLVIDLT